MKTQAILLVHGMGVNTAPTPADPKAKPPVAAKPGSFGQEFIDATTTTLQQFAKHKTDTLAAHFDLVEFNYDGFFDKMRQTMANQAKPMNDRLTTLGTALGMPAPLHLVGLLNSWESKFGGDSFFYTHVLDVIFYGEMLGAVVRVKAAKMIVDLVKDYGANNVHVIAHSLGTAVVHDTLQLLYRPESDPDDEIPDLSPVNHRLGSVWMFANVSRLVNSVTRLTDPLGSVVKPGSDGCTNAFINVRHKLDPFTWLAQFDPQNDGSWIPENIYATRYNNTVTDLVVEANTHSFTRYLEDPKVVGILLPFLLKQDFKTTPAELKQVADTYAASTLNGAAAALAHSLQDLQESTNPIASWNDFLNAAKTFKDAVENITKHF